MPHCLLQPKARYLMLTSPAASDLEGRILGGCRLLGRLSTSAMGDVYLAEQLSLGNRLVAVKVVPARAAASSETTVPAAEAHFMHEAQVLAKFAHPNILTIHDSGVSDDLLYLIMQYVPDGSLGDVIRGKGHVHLALPVPPARAAAMIGQIASALQYTHERGMVHRDVKPSNVLVQVQPDGAWHLLLADFGIARNLESTANLHRVTGTIAYMAPEQFAGKFSPASDQYSLGVLAYLLLTGRTPFRGSPVEVMTAHHSAPPPDPAQLNSDVSPMLAAVVLRALAKNPANRWPSVMAFSQALSQAAANNPASAATRTADVLAPAAAAAAAALPLAAAATHPVDALPAPDSRATTVLDPRVPPPGASESPTVPLPVYTSRYSPARTRRRLLLTALAALLLLALVVLALRATHPSATHPPRTHPTVTTHQSSPPPAPNSGPGGSLAPGSAPSPTAAPTTAPTAPPTPTSAPAAAPQAQPSPTTAPTATPSPTPSPAASPTPSAAATGDAAQISATPAQVVVQPGKTVVLHATLTNTGTSTWSGAAGYAAACDTASHPTASCSTTSPVSLGNHTVAPGQSLDVTVTFAAPTTPGTYQIWWNLTHNGTFFTSPDSHVVVKVAG
jgi:eukaryotic-like serine/threonine-protein kinase